MDRLADASHHRLKRQQLRPHSRIVHVGTDPRSYRGREERVRRIPRPTDSSPDVSTCLG
ncbi:hypothetical protein ACNJ7K_11810 [Rhodococcus aetherivorans]|uniref:DinB/UmuC family translesion DNA polymerase n=1 Tax=Rhodococcus rhodochrous TaxID=1829 RepID=UPI003557ACD7